MTPVYDGYLPSTLLLYWTPAGARTQTSARDKKSSALPTPLPGPAEANIHVDFLGCIHLISDIHLISEWIVL